MVAGSIGPNEVLDKTFKLSSGETITGYQVVRRGDNQGECEVATNDTEPYLGVAQVNPNGGVTLTADDAVRVRMAGISKVQCAAAVAADTKIAVVGQGLVDDATPGTAGDYYIGLALEAGAQLIDVITVDLANKNTQYFAS